MTCCIFFFACTIFLSIVHVSPTLQCRSRMPLQAYSIQLESRRVFLSLVCGAKKLNKVIPAAHVPRGQAYAEMDMPAYLLHELTEGKDLQMRM